MSRTTRATNDLEDRPIQSKGVQKNFEELLEEQMRKEQQFELDEGSEYQAPKRDFLKRGSRSSLSNAQVRSKAANQHIQTIQTQQQGEPVREEKPKRKPAAQPPKRPSAPQQPAQQQPMQQQQPAQSRTFSGAGNFSSAEEPSPHTADGGKPKK